ncbi:MAG TPA: hypothetical protein VNT24_13000, partial [Propionibacteriaceae bacterium]|nr:hypothetical protein [Propionibacteriaceae bacterium]
MATDLLTVPAADLPATTPETPAPSGYSPSAYWRAIIPGAATVVWILSLRGADPRTMSQLGLLSLFSAATVLALVLLSVGLLLCLHWNVREWLLGLHLVTFLALIHGTPAVLYGTVRYSWSFKHVGIVDYILRTGTIDPSIQVGGIYHNWPGFFAGSALLTSVQGSSDALGLALWSPLA